MKVLSKRPGRRILAVGEVSDVGSLVSLHFLDVGPHFFRISKLFSDLVSKPHEQILPLSFVEYAASRQNISLRTGCACNPGAGAALLGTRARMEAQNRGLSFKPEDFGVVRISLGLASNFDDVMRVIQFATMLACQTVREHMMDDWRCATIATSNGALHM